MDLRHDIHEQRSAERTAIVLGGGGSLGASQVGMLRELLAHGIRADFLVGVSAGALNGAFFAEQPSSTRLDTLANLWSGVSTRVALGLGWRSLLGVVGLRDHIASPAHLRGVLQRNLVSREFAALSVPLHVVCADLYTGEAVLLSNGDLHQAVLASAAIPGVFPAVEVGGRALVDGAVANLSPIEAAVRLGATRIFMLTCQPGAPELAPGRGALARAMHAIQLIAARQLRTDLARFGAQLPIHVVPAPAAPCAAYDYSCGRELVALARQSTRQWYEATLAASGSAAAA